jgi:hypothetical protein
LLMTATGRVTEQPPNAAHSATIPRIRILLIPRTAGIQAQGEGKGEPRKLSVRRWNVLCRVRGSEKIPQPPELNDVLS